MKRISSILLAVVLLFTAAGCSGGGTDTPPAPKPVSDPSSTENQIDLISDYAYLWEEDFEEGGLLQQYAVTDLDGNGRLELITAVMDGSGYFSVNHFYEVTEDFLSLEPLDEAVFEDASQPDLSDLLQCYNIGGINYYICEDILRNGFAESYFIKEVLSLQDGCIFCECMGSITGTLSGEGYNETLYAEYQDEDGYAISPYTFAEIESDWFGDADESFVAGIGWLPFEKKDAYHDELKASYEDFGPQDGVDESTVLFETPGIYYGLQEHYYDGAYADGMFACPYDNLCGDWTLTGGEIDGFEWTAEEEESSGIITFFRDGTVSFTYKSRYNDPEEFIGMEVEEVGEPMNWLSVNDWHLEFYHDASNEFAADLLNDSLELYWFQEPYEPGLSPVVSVLHFIKEE